MSVQLLNARHYQSDNVYMMTKQEKNTEISQGQSP